MYKMIFDYHTHTIFSHGKGTIEDNVQEAIRKGLKAIAISDHGPGHLTYGIKRKSIDVMRNEVDRLKKIYKDIDIYLSIEANICKDSKNNYLDLADEEIAKFDFILAGYHYGITKGYCIRNFLHRHGFKIGEEKLRAKNTDMVIKAIENNNIKMLTHPGDKAPFDMRAISKACAKNNVLMEISTHHAHLTVEEIKIAYEEGANFVISSDAHVSSRIGTFQGGIDRAKEANLPIERIVNIEEV